MEMLEGPGGQSVTAKSDEDGVQRVKLEGGAGSPAAPSIVKGTDGANPERLATFAEQEIHTFALEELAAQGRSANAATWAVISVTTSASNLPNVPVAGGRGVILQNTTRRTLTVWVGRANTITADDDSVSPVWAIEPGDEASFDVSNANELWVRSTGATKLQMRVESRS